MTGHAGFAETYLRRSRSSSMCRRRCRFLMLRSEHGGFSTRGGLSWRQVADPDGDPVTYRYAYGFRTTIRPFSIAPAPIAAETKTVSSAPRWTGPDYLWKVIAEDGKGGSTESETRRFTIN